MVLHPERLTAGPRGLGGPGRWGQLEGGFPAGGKGSQSGFAINFDAGQRPRLYPALGNMIFVRGALGAEIDITAVWGLDERPKKVDSCLNCSQEP